MYVCVLYVCMFSNIFSRLLIGSNGDNLAGDLKMTVFWHSSRTPLQIFPRSPWGDILMGSLKVTPSSHFQTTPTNVLFLAVK